MSTKTINTEVTLSTSSDSISTIGKPSCRGHCRNCGTQLYRFKKAPSLSLNSKKKREIAKPLTIPGKVANGHCLVCIKACNQSRGVPSAPPPTLIHILDQTFKDILWDSTRCLEAQSSERAFYLHDQQHVKEPTQRFLLRHKLVDMLEFFQAMFVLLTMALTGTTGSLVCPWFFPKKQHHSCVQCGAWLRKERIGLKWAVALFVSAFDQLRYLGFIESGDTMP